METSEEEISKEQVKGDYDITIHPRESLFRREY